MSAATPEDNPYVRDPPTAFEPVSQLDEATAETQTQQLREAIRYHDYRYYVQHDPIIADRVYDALFTRLEELESAFGLQTPDSPTQRVGGEPQTALETVEHVAPMLSIDSSGEADEVREFDRRVRDAVGEVGYVCEPKFDGVSVEVVYEDGRLDRAATRGDGETGDDITVNIRTVPSIPQRLRNDPPTFLALRGEVYIPLSAFAELNRDRVEAEDEPFANPRNAAAGTLRQLDPSVTAQRPLTCAFYELLDASVTFEWHWDVLESLPRWGLPVSDLPQRVTDIEAAIAYRDNLLERRDSLDFEMDGIVIKVDDREACEALGATSRAPRWAFAYKFPPRSEVTTVRDILVQVGRTGRLTPVALLDPVDVGGVTVSRASLHNPEIVTELGVSVGDRVRVRRAGDVIPEVAEVIESTDDTSYAFPNTCPVCDGEVARDGPNAFCTNGLACPAQLRRSIEHYTSAAAMDIEGLGPERIEQLLEAGLLEDGIADLYSLDAADLKALDGWGEQSARKLLDELAASKQPPLEDFLVALGIPSVGPTIARDLANAFGTLDAVMAADFNALQHVDGIGPETATAIQSFFASERNQSQINRLRNAGVEPVSTGPVDDALADLTVVFTGTLSNYTREEAKTLIERHGGRVTGSVSSATDYLVVGADPGTRKPADAEEYGVPTLDEQAFEALLEEQQILD